MNKTIVMTRWTDSAFEAAIATLDTFQNGSADFGCWTAERKYWNELAFKKAGA